MAESTPTRTEVVTANIAAVKALRGNDDYIAVIAQCAQDISLSLAALVDAGSNSGTSGTSGT